MQNGIRIQKVLSAKGILSRRKTEEAIRQKRINVNGRPAKIGQHINPKKDLVTLDGKRLEISDRVEKVYIMLNKPRGYITTTSDSFGRKTVMDLVKDCPERVFPVGRLDMNSEGLLLLTNDGDFANNIMHPSGEVDKVYRVTVREEITEEQLIELSTGIKLDDGYVTPAMFIHVLEKSPSRSVLIFTISEGRNRIIRKMCAAVGLEVIRLKRTSIGPIKLGMLQPGKYRELKPSEINAIKGSVRKARRRSRTKGD